ncbi:Cupin domain protein, RmlC-type [Alteracholeplasma palmae J233]|uniref:Cupin domain protein, RmlC-type n=1 Tax=Alteracholeplasma palmae (strain ATCC 49389 / J233) TaxID=1318466 RepID=U4KQP6_ALTPJ|nr:cupin domain-containing protein [Alteracholeplasma palmae]CCV64945.1 Cupin domain protein, RmlC-type [Alteracholeplasma palmae J233]
MIKNIEHATVFSFKDEVVYQKGQVVSKTLSQNKNVSLTAFAFDKNEGLTKHKSPGDALVTILEGSAVIEIGDEIFELTENQSIIMPANVAHALFAKEQFKMLLTVIFPEK